MQTQACDYLVVSQPIALAVEANDRVKGPGGRMSARLFRLSAALVAVIHVAPASGRVHAQRSAPAQAPRVDANAAAAAHEKPAEPDNRSVLQLGERLARGDITLSVQDVVSSAVRTLPEVRAAESRRAAAAAGASAASIDLYPRVGLSASYRRLSTVESTPFPRNPLLVEEQVARQAAGVPPPPDAFDLRFPQSDHHYGSRAELSYPLTAAIFRTLPSVAALDELSAAERWNYEVARRDAALRGHRAYYEYLRARAQVAIAEATLQDARRRRAEIEAQIAAGVLGRAPLLTVESQLGRASMDLESSRARVESARAELAYVMGRTLPPTIATTETLARPAAKIDQNSAALVAQGLRQRPELHYLRHLVGSREQEDRAAAAGGIPSLSLVAGADLERPSPRSFPQEDRFGTAWDVGVLLEWSPNDLIAAGHRGDQTQAQATLARVDLERMSKEIRLEITRAITDLQAFSKMLSAAQQNLTVSEDNYETHMLLFRAGQIPSRDVQDAENELRLARLDMINAAIDVRLADAHLRYAVGDTL